MPVGGHTDNSSDTDGAESAPLARHSLLRYGLAPPEKKPKGCNEEPDNVKNKSERSQTPELVTRK